MKSLFAVFGLCVLGAWIYPRLCAQDCAANLEIAEQRFAEGHIEEVTAEMLSPCLTQGSSAEKARALRLLTIKYLLLPEPSRASDLFRELLREQPEFRIDTTQKTDPAELIYLYQAFRTRPVASIRLQTGVAFARPVAGTRYGIGNEPSPDALIFRTPAAGLALGIDATVWAFSRHLGILSGIHFANMRFDYREQLVTYGSTFANQPAIFVTTFKESATLIQWPLMVRYDFDYNSPYNFVRRRIVPFVAGGLTGGLLLRTQFLQPTRVNTVSKLTTAPQNIAVTDLRTRNLAWLSGAAGARLKYDRVYFTLEARYFRALFNAVEVANRYQRMDVVRDLGYIDDDFRTDGLTIFAGIEMDLYAHRPKRANR